MYGICMVYLPTFGWFLGQMLVNTPYMEHMDYKRLLLFERDFMLFSLYQLYPK